jgi:large subunit ribosomal protein L24
MIRIKKNDLVQVISGKDRGKRGEVIEILPGKDRVKVKGVALHVRHLKLRDRNGGGIRIGEGFIHISKVMPICQGEEKPCRVRIKTLEGGVKTRVSHRSGGIL